MELSGFEIEDVMEALNDGDDYCRERYLGSAPFRSVDGLGDAGDESLLYQDSDN